MIDLMNEPPTMITNNTGTIIQRSLLSGNPEKRVVSPYSTRPAVSSRVGSNPKPKYPMESSEKAIIIDFRKPILSAYAPVKIGNK
jgi:hypothetical protein